MKPGRKKRKRPLSKILNQTAAEGNSVFSLQSVGSAVSAWFWGGPGADAAQVPHRVEMEMTPLRIKRQRTEYEWGKENGRQPPSSGDAHLRWVIPRAAAVRRLNTILFMSRGGILIYPSP